MFIILNTVFFLFSAHVPLSAYRGRFCKTYMYISAHYVLLSNINHLYFIALKHAVHGMHRTLFSILESRSGHQPRVQPLVTNLMYHLWPPTSCTTSGHQPHVPPLATKLMYHHWPPTSYTTSGHQPHVPPLATNLMYHLWPPNSRTTSGHQLHVPPLATNLMYHLWPPTSCTTSGHQPHVPPLATNLITVTKLIPFLST